MNPLIRFLPQVLYPFLSVNSLHDVVIGEVHGIYIMQPCVNAKKEDVSHSAKSGLCKLNPLQLVQLIHGKVDHVQPLVLKTVSSEWSST